MDRIVGLLMKEALRNACILAATVTSLANDDEDMVVGYTYRSIHFERTMS